MANVNYSEVRPRNPGQPAPAPQPPVKAQPVGQKVKC